MGKTDRLIRVFISVILTLLYFTGMVSGAFGIMLIVIGGIFLATATIGFCPLYTLLGINTCGKQNQ
jgi:hypothetical protein